MLRPYLVHSCDPIWCLEGCDGVVVFAESDPAALAAGRHLTEDPPEAAAEHDERLEPLRAAWQGEPLRPSNEHARLWWLAGWGDPESRCLECGLGEWAPEVPESVYCVECMLCAGCGHDEDCPDGAYSPPGPPSSTTMDRTQTPQDSPG